VFVCFLFRNKKQTDKQKKEISSSTLKRKRVESVLTSHNNNLSLRAPPLSTSLDSQPLSTSTKKKKKNFQQQLLPPDLRLLLPPPNTPPSAPRQDPRRAHGPGPGSLLPGGRLLDLARLRGRRRQLPGELRLRARVQEGPRGGVGRGGRRGRGERCATPGGRGAGGRGEADCDGRERRRVREETSFFLLMRGRRES